VECVLDARMDFGAIFVITLAIKVVHIQRVEKVMDIAVFAKTDIGETFVTRHVAKIVQAVRKKLVCAFHAILDFGDHYAQKNVVSRVHLLNVIWSPANVRIVI
jgi:hypothetical protein